MPLGVSKNLFQRFVSAVSLLPLVLGTVYLGDWWFVGLLVFGGALMATEWVKLTVTNTIAVGVGLAAAVSALVIWAEYTTANAGELISGLLVSALVGIGLVKLLSFKKAGWFLIGFAYVSLPLVAMWWLRTQDVWWVLWVFLIVWGTDIGGYFAGKGIGGPRLAPKLSPKKTWSGLVGGMALSMGASYCLYLIVNFGPSLNSLFVLSALLAVGAQVGDLIESGVKRAFDAKDSGSIIPGHGGVLDRVDGLVFVAPAMVAVALLAPSLINVAS
ncbi:MAG: phosphatidate cytidylyltransferase [Kordiimonadaceae bacterium]|nr:phosphatidate cytidylyltransferase [Kordiimonadaceae bacterium]